MIRRITCAMVWLSAANLFAQSYFLKIYSSENGLPQNQVFAINQDSLGFIWFGTAGGLTRYDGRHFRTFTKEDGLASNVIRDICVCRNGQLWFATDEGVARYDAEIDSFTNLDYRNGLGRGIVRQIAEDGQGRLWFATAAGLSLFDAKTQQFTTWTERNGLPSAVVYSVAAMGDSVAVGTARGLALVRYRDGQMKSVVSWTPSNGMPHHHVTAVRIDRLGVIWAATPQGPVRVTAEGLRRVPQLLPALQAEVHSISEDSEGHLWFSSSNGAIRVLPQESLEFKSYSERQGFPTSQIYRTFEDREGNVWFGTFAKGAVKLVSERILHYRIQDGLIDNMVIAIDRTSDGTFFLGTPRGVTVMQADRSFRSLYELREHSVIAITTDAAGITWLGSQTGLLALVRADGVYSPRMNQRRQVLLRRGRRSDGFVLVRFDDVPELGRASVSDLLVDLRSRLWFVSVDQGIGRIDWNDDGNWRIRIFRTQDGLLNNNAWCLFEDSGGRLWAGTIGGGLAVFDEATDRFTALTRDHGLPDNVILSLAEDADGYLWMGTERGLTRLRIHDWPANAPSDVRDRLQWLTRREGLIDNIVNAVYIDPMQRLWIGGYSGLQVLDPKSGHVLRTLTRKRGLSDNEIPTGNSLVADDRQMWIGTGSGLTVMPLDLQLEGHRTVNSVILTSFAAQNASGDMVSNFAGRALQSFAAEPAGLFDLSHRISHIQNNVAFQFVSPSFLAEDDVTFRYRLAGFQNEWSTPSAETSVRYTNLDPGDYVFEVQATAGLGEWTGPAQCHFTILKPFYKTYWFMAFVTLLAGLATYTVYRFRELQTMRRTEELEKKIISRTRELVREKENAERLLRELQETQMHLVQSEKMASLGQLVAGVAHEINNPVAYVKANIAYLQKKSGDLRKLYDEFSALFDYYEPFKTIPDPPHDDFRRKLEEIDRLIDQSKLEKFLDDLPSVIHEMKDGVDRTQKIVEDLRNFSRLDEAQYKDVDLNESIDGTLNILKNEYKTRIQIHRDYTPLPKVYCNPGQINQVIMNILTNAIQAIEGRGDIWIRTVAGVNNILIGIRDNGPGIPEAIQARVFDPFFTTKPVGKGTGLGLSISFKIIENHKGTIFFDSRPGEGTEFKITLPTKKTF